MHFQSNTFMAVIALAMSSSLTYADFGDQLFKLIPFDGAEGDLFGYSVAIGNFTESKTVIIGAWGNDDFGSISGSAYLFDITNGELIAKLLSSEGTNGDAFGYSVGISGPPGNEFAIIGAPGDNDNGNDSGTAYIFDATNGLQIDSLLAEDGAATDSLGWSVAMIGTSAIVGARFGGINDIESGSAYLFDASLGKQTAQLLPDKRANNDQFGFDVAITGSPGKEVAIVGVWLDDDNGENSGSAYLFDVASGQMISKLLPNDGAADDHIGWAVGISGNTAIVAAVSDGTSGSAYLFDINSGVQIAKLLPDDKGQNESFGWDVAINDTTAIVGDFASNYNGSNSGSAHIFEIVTGEQIGMLLAIDGEANDGFGWSVAISQDSETELAIIGAFSDDPAGSAYIFDVTTSAKCPWDLDTSSAVGTSDLLELFAQWGTDGAADFDGDGLVSKSDLLLLLANWGPCP